MKLVLAVSVLAFILLAATSTAYAAWTRFTGTVEIRNPNTGGPDGYYLQMARAGEPCYRLGAIGDVFSFGTGFQTDSDGACTYDFAIGRYADTGPDGVIGTADDEIGLEVARTSQFPGVTGISIRSTDVPGAIGLKVINGDLWVTNNYQGARKAIAKIGKDGSYEFLNGCRLYPDGAALRSSCRIRMPLW